MVDEVGATVYSYAGGGELSAEDGPFAGDTVTSYYWNRLRIFLGTTLLWCSAALIALADQDANQTAYSHEAYPQSLLKEDSDFRQEFYQSKAGGIEFYKKHGLCFVLSGPLLLKTISTNECPTVAEALNKSGLTEVRNHQIRVVQANIIMQTPLGSDDSEAGRKAMLTLKLQAGDVVIVQGQE